MEDTAFNEGFERARSIAELLATHNGIKTVVLDLAGQSSFADFFVITTVTSFAHLRGLARQLEEFCASIGLDPINRKRRVPDDDEWLLVDLGSIVVHLMTETSRDFYELEKIWFNAKVVFPG